jgi:hypothetical protein
MNIEEKQIKDKKKVGSLNGVPVFMITTKGGLNLIASAQNGSIKYLGVGPHPCVAKFITEKTEPEVLWEISKSEDDAIDAKVFAPILPDYIQLTNRFNKE